VVVRVVRVSVVVDDGDVVVPVRLVMWWASRKYDSASVVVDFWRVWPLEVGSCISHHLRG
jgi:hypothetical protein